MPQFEGCASAGSAFGDVGKIVMEGIVAGKMLDVLKHTPDGLNPIRENTTHEILHESYTPAESDASPNEAEGSACLLPHEPAEQ